MVTWFLENVSTIIISGILVLLVLFASRSIYRAKKNGGCNGCSGCSGCSHINGSANDNLHPSCHNCEGSNLKK